MPAPPNLYALRRSILLPNHVQNFLDQSSPATVESAGMSEVAAEKEVEALERRSKMKRARPESSTWTEVRGVYRLRSGRYGASIWDQSRRTQLWLGRFGTIEDAAGAYAAAAAKLPGGRKRPKFRGVYRTPSGKYGALIIHSKGKARTWLGTFGAAEEAARAYDAAAVELHGARAITNFGPGRRVRVDPRTTQHGDLSVAEWLQVEELLKDTDSIDDKEALIDAAAILHQIALAGHGDGGRD